MARAGLTNAEIDEIAEVIINFKMDVLLILKTISNCQWYILSLQMHERIDASGLPDERCGICLDNFGVRDAVRTQCGHLFHCGCLR